MPAPFVPKRVEDFIFYYYAKLVIARSAGFEGNYRFVIDAYKRLKAGEIHISDYERELLHLAKQPNLCAYCGVRDQKVAPLEVVPRSLGGPVGIHNMVLACSSCCDSKNDTDLVEWWRIILGRHHDTLPRVPIGLYLKQAYEAHQINFTLAAHCTDLAQIFPILRNK